MSDWGADLGFWLVVGVILAITAVRINDAP